MTIYLLTPVGRVEAARRNELSDEENEPHEVTRDELLSELKRRGVGWTDMQVAQNPDLRHRR